MNADEVGQRIKAIRLDRGLSRDALFELSRVSTSSIIRIEQGRQEPTASKLAAFSKAMECTTDELLGLVPFTPRRLKPKDLEAMLDQHRARFPKKVGGARGARRSEKRAYRVATASSTPFGGASDLMYPNIHESLVLPAQTLLLPDRFDTIWATLATRALTSGDVMEAEEISTPATGKAAA